MTSVGREEVRLSPRVATASKVNKVLVVLVVLSALAALGLLVPWGWCPVYNGADSVTSKECTKRDEGVCKAADELYPGEWKDGQWVPEKCEMENFPGGGGCLGDKKLLFVGDSLGRQIFTALSKEHPDVMEVNGFKRPRCPELRTCNRAVSLPGSDSWSVGKLWVSGSTQPVPSDPFSLQLIAEADYIVVSQGMWDMGAYFCGPIGFFESFKAHILSLKGMAKPSAQLYVWNLHTIHYEKMGHNSWSFRCNPPGKVAVFRDVIEEVTSCTNTTVLQTADLTKSFESPDGIHYTPNGGIPTKTQLLLNHICGECPIKPTPPRPCNPAPAKQRWKEEPSAWKPCGKNAQGRELGFGCPYAI